MTKFRRIDDSNEQDVTQDHQKKLDEFEWADDDNEESEIAFECTSEEIEECERLTEDFILDKLGPEHLSFSSEFKVMLSIEIDINLHRILMNRFKDEWTLDSRLNAVMDVNKLLVSSFKNDFNKARINNVVKEILPDSSRKEYVFSSLTIIDDPLVLKDSGAVIVEIELECKPLE